jgi:hypothetical protein
MQGMLFCILVLHAETGNRLRALAQVTEGLADRQSYMAFCLCLLFSSCLWYFNLKMKNKMTSSPLLTQNGIVARTGTEYAPMVLLNWDSRSLFTRPASLCSGTKISEPSNNKMKQPNRGCPGSRAPLPLRLRRENWSGCRVARFGHKVARSGYRAVRFSRLCVWTPFRPRLSAKQKRSERQALVRIRRALAARC